MKLWARVLHDLTLLLLVVAIPLAFAADVKISALPAASAVNDADEFPSNQAGTTRKITLGQGVRTHIAGNSGAAGLTETWQVLTANCTANSTTTLTTCMTTTALPAGTWLFEYHVVWQSATTTVGVNFSVDSTATVTRIRTYRRYQSTGGTAASGVADGEAQVLTGSLVEAMATRLDNGSLGPNTGVDTVNVDQLDTIRGILVTSTSGDLLLKHASETATSTQMMADTMLLLRRIN